jgi:ElaB/YqjD/DUF883 family membrane-anchored ribosome-binding protein
MQQDESIGFDSTAGSDKKRVGQQVAEAVSSAAHTAGHKMDATVDYAESVAHNVKDQVTTFYDRDLRDLKDRALEYTRTQPLSALLIAVGAGIVLGWLTRRER